MAEMTWLHLSDWHQRGKEFDRRVVRDALMTDIRERTKISPDLGQIDFVVFSGDVTFRGKGEEYEAAIHEFFTPLLEAAGMGRERLFIVPGNHDLDRDGLKVLPPDLAQTLGSAEAVNEWLTTDFQRQALLAPFMGYARFVSDYLGPVRPLQAEPAWAQVCGLEIQGKHVAIIGLNSAWLSTRNRDSAGVANDYGYLILGEPQVYSALQRAPEADLYIAAMHHSLDWLMEFDYQRTADRLYRKCHFILHGHQHLPRVNVLSGTAGDCIVIPAGASYDRRAPAERRFANGYNFVHLDLDTGQGTVYLRRYEDPQGWIRDTVTTGDETPGFYEFSLPKGGRKVPKGKKGALASRGYEVQRLIAQGGMSAVWLATSRGRQVAVKELRPFAAANEQTITKWKEQFANEYRILSRLQHPNIPQLLDYFEHDDTYYLVMDYIDGVTLEERSKRLPAEEERVLGWARQLCTVLRYLHSQEPPVIFRDLNPSNVMITRADGRIMLIDFGIAKSFSDEQYRYVTQTVLKLGTEGYMPPEQNSTATYEEEGEGGTDARSDIYSLGATLYYLLTKVIPRDSVRRAIDYRRYGEDRLMALRELNPSVSRNTEEVILNALQLPKEDRYQTVAELEEALFSAYEPPATVVHPKDGAEMILIPAGPFWMGANDAGEDEKPRRQVYLDGYYIDRHPVTYGQFKRFVDETGYRRQAAQMDSAYLTDEWHKYYEPGREDYPVVNITWHDANAYADWAGKDLPTEEQWEKAARGKNGSIYPWGSKWDSAKCNSFLLARPELIHRMIPMWTGGRGTLPVGCFPEGVSPFGIMDAAGNVLEWTQSDYTIPNAQVVRGGCWYRDAPTYFRCAKRYWYFREYSVNWLGLRCVTKLDGVGAGK